MPEYEIVDAHVHLYRDVATEKQALPIPGRRDSDRWGNADSVTDFMDREDVSHIVALNFFPTAVMRRVLQKKNAAISAGGPGTAMDIDAELAAGLRRQNEWLCRLSQDNPRILAGIGVQKLLSPEELVEEVELRATQGARTVKMVPGWFHEYPNDRAFWPMYARCAELGLAITADTGSLGFGRHSAHPDEFNHICYGEPNHFIEVLDAFPTLIVVMAHLPSAFWDDRVDLARRFPNVMFDISGGFDAPGFHARDGHRAVAEEDAVRIMRKVGIERIMFGSDGPHVMLQPYLEQVLRLELTASERLLLLRDNARRIYRF